MYDLALLVHSYLRWVVLGLALISFVSAISGWLGQRLWRASDEQKHQAFIMALDAQFLLGLVLYVFLSPTTQAAFADFPAAMKNSVLRFWGLEHAATMFLAVAAAHVGKAMSSRATGSDRHRPMVIGIVIFAFFVLAAFPWPGLEHGRPFFRGF
jgi:hypothetical protein